jgi:putative thioredoxin
MSSNIVAITLENFQQIIIEQSKTQLILVDFWAEQVPESIELKNKLSAKAATFADVMVLATVDCQAQQQIAQQFGIQGLPTAVLVKDGQPLDGLTGPQTDESIATFLEKYLPKEQDHLLAQAKVDLSDKKFNEAFTAVTAAYKLDSERIDIKFVLADVYIALGKVTEAESLLSTIKMVDQDSEYQALMAKIELASQAANSPEVQALEEQVNAEPENIELKHQLAAQYSQVGRDEDALVLLFVLVQKDGSDTVSKQLLLDILKVLPDGDPLVTKYRRKLYTLLY